MKRLLLSAALPALLAVHHLRVNSLVAAGPDAAGAASAQVESPRVLPAPSANMEEDRVFRSLTKPTQVIFEDLALSDAMQFLSAFHGLSIRVDAETLRSANIAVDTPVTLDRQQVSFQRILNLLIEPLGLDWYVDGAQIVVTTRTAAAAAVSARLEKRLEPELQIIDYLCRLTEAQREKLQTAARGDARRLIDAIAVQAKKIPVARTDEQRVNDVCVELERLQREVQTGPFGNASLFRKILETTLTPAQFARYSPIRTVLQAKGLVGTLQRGSEVILGVHLAGANFSDEDLARLKGLTALGILRIEATEVTDPGLASLKDLTNIQELYLGNTRVTDAGLTHLESLKKLRVLDLGGATGVTDAGLVKLSSLVSLEKLGLAGTQLTGAGLARLRGLTRLAELELSMTHVTDAGLDDLVEMTNLRELGLRETKVTSAGLARLKKLVNMQALYLTRSAVADDGLSHLDHMADLRVLTLSDTQITDAGLVRLKGLINLRKLYVGGTQVTDAGIADLNRELPDLQVIK